MNNKFITIERQYGSGGSIIGKLVAKKLGIKYYNREILEMTAQKCGVDPENLEHAEENVPTSFLYSLMMASNPSRSFEDSLPLSDKLFIIESNIIQDLAKQEDGFVLVGRCGNYILESYGCFGVYIYADKQKRMERAIKEYGIDPKKAESLLKKADKRREVFYNTNSDRLWQDKDQYALCLNSLELGDELCADIIVEAYKRHCQAEHNK